MGLLSAAKDLIEVVTGNTMSRQPLDINMDIDPPADIVEPQTDDATTPPETAMENAVVTEQGPLELANMTSEREALRDELAALKTQVRKFKSEERSLAKNLKAAQSRHDESERAHNPRESQWQTEKTQYQSELFTVDAQLRDSQAQYASLLKHLQPNESLEPADIVQKFTRLNIAVKDLCYTLHRAVLSEVPGISDSFESNNGDLTALQSSLPGAQLLVQSEQDTGRPADEFLEFAFRYTIISALHLRLFSLFQIQFSPEQNQFIHGLYDRIRLREPQLIAAKWRSSLFLASEPGDPQPWILKTVEDINDVLHSVAAGLFPSLGVPKGIFAQRQNSLKDLLESTYRLNKSMKASCLSLDFHSLLFDGRVEFTPDDMMPHGDHIPFCLPANHIIAAVNLGLKSSISSGGEASIEYVTQIKAEVLTEGYFTND